MAMTSSVRTPSFTNMKHLFPTLFTTLVPGGFHCETCSLAKSHRVNFPLSMNKSSVFFALVHYEVWVLHQFLAIWVTFGM